MKLNYRKKNRKIIKSLVLILFFYSFFVLFKIYFINLYFDIGNKYDILFSSKEKNIQENIELRKKIEELNLKNIFANYYYNKAENLSKKIEFVKEINSNRKIFKVFNSGDYYWNSSDIIFNDKVEKGDLVYFKDNFLLGVVEEKKNNYIKLRYFSDINFKNKFVISDNGKNIFIGNGVGIGNGLIKVILPREIEVSDKAVLLFTDNSSGLVGYFLKDDFKLQDVQREVYFKLVQNPYEVMEVEI